MSFTIVWEPGATDDIDQAWAEASKEHRAVLENAIETLLLALRDYPSRVGESRGSEIDRIAFVPPLVAYFHIEREESLVRVLAASVAFPSE